MRGRESGALVFVVSLVALAGACGDNTPARHGTGPDGGPNPDTRADVDAGDDGDAALAAGDALAEMTTDLPGENDANRDEAETQLDGGDASDASDTSDAGDASNGRDTSDVGDASDGRDASDGGDASDGSGASDGGDASDGGGASDGGDASDSGGLTPSPSCVIARPSVGPSHPALNGVLATLGGDRTSADGAPYAVTFAVTTDISDGNAVELAIDDGAAPTIVTTFSAQAIGGKAVFTNVALVSGLVYDVVARCTGDDGRTNHSEMRPFPVDAIAPELAVSKPHAGEAIPPTGLTNGAFPVCASTTSGDAVALEAALGSRRDNLCVSAGGSPDCKPVAVVGTDVCVDVPCSGDAPFDITVTLGDRAGNVQKNILLGVSCFSTLPSVRIVSPASDAPPFADVSKHLLAANQPQGFRDLDATATDAQTNVVACANRAGMLELHVGLDGATLPALGSAVPARAAEPADGCPAGFAFAATFADVTLPESTEATDTSLVLATELFVQLTDLSATKNTSPPVELWVDSIAPVLRITAPVEICGSYHQSSDAFMTSATLTSTGPIVVFTLTNDTSTKTFSSTTFTTLTFPAVSFAQGVTSVVGTAHDAAGNVTGTKPNPCLVTVGPNPP
jgi:hypothetical protein